MTPRLPSRLLAPAAVLLLLCAVAPALAQKLTSPKDFLGHAIGDDYFLANYTQLTNYWARLDRESDRLKVVRIGTSAEGRPMFMGIVTSLANHRKLAKLRETSAKLAHAEIPEKEARKLADDGRAVVWIDGGLHASEILCAQVLIETTWQLVSGRDAETQRFLDDCVVLLVHANPDGMDLCADWYMREKDPAKRSLAGLPRLYQKYIGHDNNRDFYASTQAETKAMNRVMYREWFPQLVYNHHQPGPAGTVLFCPPFRDPFNYNFQPLVVSGIDGVGAAMMNRFLAENKPGATTRSGARYSMWWNGGLRTTACFHNMIGILTETIGSPTPMQIPFNPSLQLPRADYLAPVAPQTWHFRQSVDYSVTANKAILDYASRHRSELLWNFYKMGRDNIALGKGDSWTTTPKVVEAAKSAKSAAAPAAGAARFEKLFRDPAQRNPRAYIVPANQRDFPTATKFINCLIETGVKVQRAVRPFEAAGKSHPAGSFVVSCAQAFRAHVLDMFEPQDHPNDFAYPGAPPTPPYDSAGWTLAFQMGVKFERVFADFDGLFEPLDDVVPPPPAPVLDEAGAVGFFLHMRANDSFRAVNRLLAAGEEVRRLREPFVAEGFRHDPGMYFITRRDTTLPLLQKTARELGTRFIGSKEAPGREAVPLRAPRIALWDRYGGSMASGWTRWILEQFEFPFNVVFPPELDAGGLRGKFDVIVLVDGAMSGLGGAGGGGSTNRAGGTPVTPQQPAAPAGDTPPPDTGVALNIPPEFAARRGSITTARTVPQLKKFLEDGGTILAIGSSTRLARDLGLPVRNHLVEERDDGREVAFTREKFYVPGSVLEARLDLSHPLTWGMEQRVDMMFVQSPVMKLDASASADSLRRVAWFDSAAPLRSGWAWGQQHLKDGVAVAEAQVGRGRLVLYGPEVLFRAQPHGTFKLVFNGLFRSVEPARE